MGLNAAVLAGGRSTRMGQDKALVPIDGVPMALRMAGVLRQGGCENIHLVGRQASLVQLGLPLIRDVLSTHHPLNGVASALSELSGELILIAPCDLISLEVSHVQTLLQHKGPCIAVSDGQTHPLLGILPKKWAVKADQLARQGAPAWHLTESLPRVELPFTSLFDANTPNDLPRS